MPHPGPKRVVGVCIVASRGIRMLIVESHQYGGNWVFYVIAPIILLGSIACLWWIVRGAIGVFGPGTTAVGSQKASPLKPVRSRAPFDQAAGISTMPASLLGRGTGRPAGIQKYLDSLGLR